MNERTSCGPLGGFTLVEILVSVTILTLLLLMLVSLTDATRKTWSFTSSKVEEFRDAREAFESLTRRLSQATLNTFWDYDNPNTPTKYLRQSELRFISGNLNTITATSNYPSSPTHGIFFQAPLGYVANTGSFGNLTNLLNTWGYFVEFGNDSLSRPGFITGGMPNPPALRYRFRLMEMMEPSESLTLYQYTSGTTSGGTPKNASYTTTEWFTTPFNGISPYTAATRPVHALAENVAALVLLPKLAPQDEQSLQTSGTIPTATLGTSLSPQYTYDSTTTNTQYASLNPHNQLPPIVSVTMVAVDEVSFSRYQGSGTTRPTPDPLYNNAPFTSSASYAADLQQLESNLLANHINYRVFTTDVSIKAAKWSRLQTN